MRTFTCSMTKFFADRRSSTALLRNNLESSRLDLEAVGARSNYGGRYGGGDLLEALLVEALVGHARVTARAT